MSERGRDFQTAHSSGTDVTVTLWHYNGLLLWQNYISGSVCRVCSSHASSLPLPSGPDLRAGSGTWWLQEYPERPSSLWERPGRPRQIQDPATDQAGQHQAEDRRVRSLIRSLRPSATYPFWMVTTSRSLADTYQHAERHPQTLKLTNTHISYRLNWSSLTTEEASLTERQTPAERLSGSTQGFANALKKT